MKKLFRTILAVAVAATAMTSCAKELSEKFESGVKVDMVGSMPETKTAFADPSGSQYPVIWKEGDNVAVIVNFGTGTPTALPVTPSADGKTAKFSAELPASIDPPYTFMVISPRNAWVSVNSTDKRLNYLIPSTQTASKDVVDPAAQVLVGVTDEITELPADAIPITFKHAVAYGKITLKNLDVEGRAIQSITVKSETPIAGRWFYTPSTGEFAVNSGSNSIEIKTSDTEDVLFAAAPADISDKKLTVSVSVYGGVYTKEITVPAEKTFKVGTISKFSVDMTGATFEKSKVYTLLKNASALKEGDEIVMASSAPVLMTKDGKTPKNEEEAAAASKLGIVALGTQQNGNNRTGIVITDLYDETAGTITSPGDAVEVFTVEKGTADGTFAFKGKNGKYIVRPKQSGNYLRSQDANDDAAGWTVTLRNEPKFSQYAMDIVTTNAQYTATAKYIQINPNTGNQIVSCYANTQQEICIFVYDPSAGPVDKKDVVKWVPSAAGSEVFANGDGDATVEPTTADWLTWDKATKTVAWTEAAMPRQAKLTFTNGSTYDLTQIDAKVMAGKWTLSGDIRTGTTKGSVAKATATSTSGATYGSKGGITKNNWYDDGWTAPSKVTGGVNLPVTVTYNAEGEDPGKYLDPTATGTSADRAKAQKNNLVLTGLYENLTMPARAEVNYDEKWARLYLVIENKNQQLTSGVYSGEYASFQTELQRPNGDWELGFANGGINYYLGELTVTGGATKVAYPASQKCVYYPTYNMVGILVNRFATETSTAGTELVRSTKSVWTKTHISASGSAYARVFQNALTFEMKESVGPEPEPEPKTVEEVLTKAGKNPANYEKLPFWHFKNQYYQSNSNNKTALITGSGALLNKFIATNIVSKGEIPNGSVVVTMGGDFGYRPEGWVSGKQTTTRPDRTNVQVTEVDDAWWVVGGQNFNQRAFNLDMTKASLTDAEMEEVIEKFAVFVPKPTKALPNPDAVFTTAGYKLDDYTKLELTYNKYAFYHSTHETMGGVIQNKENVPTATNLGQFVATGIIDKANIPNGSVLVVCDGYQYRPEGWQVKGEKNTADRPGNVTTAVTVVDDAWWGNFNYRAFNLAYAGNPGIPVTEMDHVIASFAIYVPKADPDPTHIDTAEKLVAFLKAATAETTTDYIMTKDVDMKNVTVPTAAGFKGTFDGKGKTIKNLAATAPLFATLDGTVKNVTLEGAFTFDPKDHKVFGALVAESNGDIEKVINKASVTATATEAEAADAYLLGGLIGKTAGKVTDCKNEGAVTLTGKALSGTMVAGVVAYASADVTDCENKGKVALNFTYTWNKADFDYIPLAKEQLVPGVGGVVGITQAAKVTGSKNYGEVVYNETAIENLTANKNRHQIGGVVAAPGGDVENCINEGAINVTSASTNRKAVVTEGTVKRENIVCVGGITGGGFHSVNQTGANIKSCNNSGAISVDTDAAQSNSAVGGIVGWLGVESTDLVAKIENCANTGNVTIKGAGKGRFAGICGGTANVVDCTNNATVTIKSTNSSSVAALGLGFHTQAHTVSGCTLEGSVVAECKIDGAGGLYGGQGNVAEEGKTYGNNVNATITTTDDTKNIGLVVGKISSGSYVVVLGTDTAPIKVKGTVNSTALTSENYVDYLFNGGASVKNKSVKAAFWN